MSDSLQPHGLQHARPPYSSPTPGACSNSRPLSRWCHSTISSSVAPFASCPQFFSDGLLQWVCPSQQVANVLELQLQHQSFQWIFRVDFLKIVWFDLLAVQETLKSLFKHHNLKGLILWCSAFVMVQLSHPCTSLVAQMVKRLPTMQETQVQSSWVRKISWRRKWQPTPVLLPGKSHGQRNLVDYSPWGGKESDTTEWLHFTLKAT